jgi:bacterioferritin-associated ferredoxin
MPPSGWKDFHYLVANSSQSHYVLFKRQVRFIPKGAKMYVCICNPFTDKDVKSALSNPEIPNTTSQIYKCCSGGNSPNCGTCVNMLKCMIVDHQSALGVQKLKDDLPELTSEEFTEDEFITASE